MTQQNNTFIDLTKLTKWIKWLLCLQVGVAVIALISGGLEYQLLNDVKNDVHTSQLQAIAAAEASDARQQVIVITKLIIFVVSGILILKWIYRANFNARQLGASEMQFTPGWSIGWYFIPIANLWKPYQVMEEIWKASANPQEWKSQSIPPLLGWWWFFWIVSNILENASFSMALKPAQIHELIVGNIVTLISDVTRIPLCLIMLAIVSKIYEMQMSHYRSRVS
ncbi:MAG: DUF4328 domain-containing protein [Armatimonadota bacterium]|nr:DUF4328 domain-containing protein [Armatimonadota bacterium]